MNTAILTFNTLTRRWVANYGKIVITSSKSKESAVSTVLDGVRRKVRMYNITRLVDAEGKEITYDQVIRESAIVKNQRVYKEAIKRSIKQREFVDEKLSNDMKQMRDLFSQMFFVDKREFNHLRDVLFYKGGYPSVDSPARIDTIFRNFAIIYKWYKYLGKEKELQKLEKKYDITITLNAERHTRISARPRKEFAEDWYAVFGKNEPIPKAGKDMLTKLMDKACKVLGEVMKASDAVAIKDAELVHSKCGVKKRDFVDAVKKTHLVRKTGMRRVSAISKDHLGHVTSEAALATAIEKSLPEELMLSE